MNRAVAIDALHDIWKVPPPVDGVDNDLVVEESLICRLVVGQPFELHREIFRSKSAELVVRLRPRDVHDGSTRSAPMAISVARGWAVPARVYGFAAEDASVPRSEDDAGASAAIDGDGFSGDALPCKDKAARLLGRARPVGCWQPKLPSLVAIKSVHQDPRVCEGPVRRPALGEGRAAKARVEPVDHQCSRTRWRWRHGWRQRGQRRRRRRWATRFVAGGTAVPSHVCKIGLNVCAELPVPCYPCTGPGRIPEDMPPRVVFTPDRAGYRRGRCRGVRSRRRFQRLLRPE
eukprot:1887116-Prymnesium_polylepis.2